MYYIIDLESNPPIKVPSISFATKEEACAWIESQPIECTICRYTIIEE
jgi:hypothetical protein